MQYIQHIIISFAIILSAYFLGNGLQHFNRHERTIAVRGLAEREIVSNLAVWKINFNISSNKLEEVRKELPLTQEQIQNFLVAKGFQASEITKGSSITDRQAQEYAAEKGNRFVASGFYSITTKNVELVEKSQQEIDELLKKGIVITSNQKNYYFTELNQIKPSMLDEAAKNAKEAAGGLAKSMDVSVGKLKSASQGVFSIENAIVNENPNFPTQAESSIKKKIRVITQVEFEIN